MELNIVVDCNDPQALDRFLLEHQDQILDHLSAAKKKHKPSLWVRLLRLVGLAN